MPTLDYGSRRVKDSSREVAEVRVYGAYGDGIVYLLTAYDKPRRHEGLDHFAAYYAYTNGFTRRRAALESVREISLGGFAGRQYRFAADAVSPEVASTSFNLYLTKKHAYALRVVGASADHPCVQQFLTSFNLSNSPAGRQIVDESNLPDKFPQPPSGQPGRGVGPDRAAGDVGPAPRPESPVDYSRVFTQKEVTRKAAIVHRAEPPYTEEARKNEITGVVVVRVVLGADGKVSNAAPLSHLPHGLTWKAILAARHIKFIPAEKDGRRVSQYATIQYNFNIY